MKKLLFVALLLVCASTVVRAQTPNTTIAGSVQKITSLPTNGTAGRIVMQVIPGDDPNTDADNDVPWIFHGQHQGQTLLGGHLWQPAPQAATDASTVDFNFRGVASERTWSLTIAGNRAFTVSNEVAGSVGRIFLTMGGSGSYVPTLPAGSKVSGAGTPGSLAGLMPTAVGSQTIIRFECTAVNVCLFKVEAEYK